MAEQQRPTSTQQVISTCPLCNIAHENPERETLPCGKHAFCSFCLELNVNLGPSPTKRPRLANITYKTVPCPACSKPADKAASDETWNLFSVPSRGHYAARRDGDADGRTQYYAMNEYLHPARDHLDEIDAAILNIDRSKRCVDVKAVAVQECIDRDFGSLKRSLERRKTELKKKVRSLSEDNRLTLSGRKQRLETERRKASEYLQLVEDKLREGRHAQLQWFRRNGDEEAISSSFELSPSPDVLFALDMAASTGALNSIGEVLATSVKVTDCYAEGIGLSLATVHIEAFFTVMLLGIDKHPCYERLSHITVELIADSNPHSVVTGKLVAQQGNKIKASYMPVYQGGSKLYIKIAGESIKGSPFSVHVLPTFRGNFVRCIASEGLIRPWGLAIADNGDLVVIDSQGTKGVYIFAPDGELRMEPFCDTSRSFYYKFVGRPPEGYCYEPKGVALIGQNIFVVDEHDHRILWFDADGKYRAMVGKRGTGEMEFDKPIGIAVHPTRKDLCICDQDNRRIQVFQPNIQNGTFLFVREIDYFWSETEKLSLHRPWDIAFNSRDNAYIVDCDNYCLRVVSPDGELLQSIGRRGEGRGEFLHISSVCVDHSDFIYTTDWVRCLVTVFNPLGEFVMEFGSEGSGEWQFYEPKGIAVDRRGRVYVSSDDCIKVFE